MAHTRSTTVSRQTHHGDHARASHHRSDGGGRARARLRRRPRPTRLRRPREGRRSHERTRGGGARARRRAGKGARCRASRARPHSLARRSGGGLADAPAPRARGSVGARSSGRVGQQGSHGAGGRRARGKHTLIEPVVGREHQEERVPRVREPGPSPVPAPAASTAPAPRGIQTPFCGRPRHGGACRGGRAAAQAAAPPRIATFPMLRHDGGASGSRGGAPGTSSDDVLFARPPPLPVIYIFWLGVRCLC